METTKNSSKLFVTGIIAALGASLCCITPVLGVVAGIGGAASAFSWLEPFRPYLIILTLGVLAWAWYQKVRSSRQVVACDCAEDGKRPFLQSKTYLGTMTVFVLLLLAFPYYSGALLPSSTASAAVASDIPLRQARLSISGMTCSGCESSVNHALSTKKGVKNAMASYEAGLARVSYDPSLITPEILKKAIEEEVGYTVTDFEILRDN
jgi:mercuric ion transport protein